MTKPYDSFIKSLDESRRAAWDVAEWLTGKGMNIKILPATTTESEADRFNHVDTGDLEIIQRIEVKVWPKIDFTSPESVPYKDVIVDEAYKIQKYAPGTLYGYFILNESKTMCMWISSATRKFSV